MSTKRESNGFIAETLDVIKETLNQVTEDLKAEKSDAKWTREIKNRLCKVGKKRKYWVYASRCDEADDGEWLYDLTWLDYQEDNLIDVKLALESEWGTRVRSMMTFRNSFW